MCEKYEVTSGFPLNTWVEAVNTTVYLINRGASIPFGCDILEEACTGKKVSYSFLKTFGCEAFTHIDSKNRTKLEAKSNVYLLDMALMNLVIGLGILKSIKL